MNILLQIGIVLGICLAGECISAVLPFILPGNIISMLLIFILLLVRILKIDHIRQKAQFLKQNMAFFLVPSSVSIIQAYRAAKRNFDSPAGYQHGFYHPYLFGHRLCGKSHHETAPKEKTIPQDYSQGADNA